MKPFLYCVRHGETQANKENRLLGRLDPPLNETGHGHAMHVASWLSDKNIGAIFTSPLQRSTTTAEVIGKATGAPVEVDPLLIEVDFGEIDGMRIDDAKTAGIYQLREADRLNYRPPGGETFVELLDRVMKFFGNRPEIGAKQPAVIVSHQGTARMIAAYLGHMLPQKAAYMPFGHESILVASKGVNNEIETKIIHL